MPATDDTDLNILAYILLIVNIFREFTPATTRISHGYISLVVVDSVYITAVHLYLLFYFSQEVGKSVLANTKVIAYSSLAIRMSLPIYTPFYDAWSCTDFLSILQGHIAYS